MGNIKKNDKLKVVTIVGTRPEIIRLSRVMTRLDKYTDHVIVHTGQNYDYELNEVFWEDLELRKPDYFLDVNTKSLGKTVGDIISKTEDVLIKEKPDALLILGDTNSCLSAYIAKRLHIPIFHMEAGNRCFDEKVPEETNRRIIDHISDYNLVYTEHARRHLLSEGIAHRRIYHTGSPMYEVLNYYSEKIENSKILEELGLKPKKYFLISTHREENVDDPVKLNKILSILEELIDIYRLPIIISTHPRTKKRLDENCNSNIKKNKLTHFLKPFGFLDYNKLQKNALCVLSDSGTISEESSILSFPAISIRESMERPEAQDAGTIILTGMDKKYVINAIESVINEFKDTTYKYSHIAPDYKVPNTSKIVLKLILGNAMLSNIWHNIQSR